MSPGQEHTQFKKYNPSIHTWSKVPVGHIVTLKPGEHTFLKGYDVMRCRDFDHLLSGSQQRELHFFKNLPHERAQVRQALKEKKASKASNTVISDDDKGERKDRPRHHSKKTTRPPVIPSWYKVEPSDSDNESHTQPSHPVVKQELTLIDLTMSDVDDTPRTQPPQPIVKQEPKIIDLTIFDAEDEPLPALVRNKCACPSNSSSLPSTPSPSPDGTDDENSDGSPVPAWPADFYVVDIVRGFEKCDEARRGRKSVPEAFVKCFDIPFWCTIFYNHHRHWDKAPAAIRDQALHAGHTPAGLWMTFLDRTHAKMAELDDRRKRKKQA
jgi:hypothetical protein